MAFLSVIIPCYNNFIFLHEMINCVINQTFSDWELIIVDDGSTDDTFEKAKEYTKDDERIRVIQRDREPKGSVVCRNIGFEMSSGKYIIHFDADDLCSPTCFEKRVSFMELHPDCDYATFPAQSFITNNKGEVVLQGEFFGTRRSNKDILELFLQGKSPFSTWNNIYRRKSIEKMLWDEKVYIYTDFSFIVPHILDGKRQMYCCIEEPDYFYRINHSSNVMTSSFTSEKKQVSTIYLFGKILDDLKKRDDYFKRRNQFRGLLTLHHERLLHSKQSKAIENYIDMIKLYYPSKVWVKYQIAYKMAQLGRYNKYWIYFLVTALLGKKNYLIEMKKRLRILFAH